MVPMRVAMFRVFERMVRLLRWAAVAAGLKVS
jgi:hypothetical protein